MPNRMEKCFYCKKDLTKEKEKIHGYHEECYTQYYKECLKRETKTHTFLVKRKRSD